MITTCTNLTRIFLCIMKTVTVIEWCHTPRTGHIPTKNVTSLRFKISDTKNSFSFILRIRGHRYSVRCATFAIFWKTNVRGSVTPEQSVHIFREMPYYVWILNFLPFYDYTLKQIPSKQLKDKSFLAVYFKILKIMYFCKIKFSF